MSEVPFYLSTHTIGGVRICRGYSRIRTRAALAPYSRAMPRALRWCYKCTSPIRNCPHPMTTVGT